MQTHKDTLTKQLDATEAPASALKSCRELFEGATERERVGVGRRRPPVEAPVAGAGGVQLVGRVGGLGEARTALGSLEPSQGI